MNYFINPNTIIIMSYRGNKTKIIENDKSFIIDEKINKIINENCNFFGSSYKGRLEYSSLVLKSNIKLPIILEESHEIIFFPTINIKSNQCMWINYNNIANIEKIDEKNVFLNFKNNQKMALGISYYSINNQINRCIKLKLNIIERKRSYFT